MWKRDESVRPPSRPRRRGCRAAAPTSTPGARRRRTGRTRRAGATWTRDVVNIGKSVVIKGELNGSEDLTIEGHVEGKIELREHVLTIGPNGRIKARGLRQGGHRARRGDRQHHREREGRHPRQRLGGRRHRRRRAWRSPRARTSAAASTCSARPTARRGAGRQGRGQAAPRPPAVAGRSRKRTAQPVGGASRHGPRRRAPRRRDRQPLATPAEALPCPVVAQRDGFPVPLRPRGVTPIAEPAPAPPVEDRDPVVRAPRRCGSSSASLESRPSPVLLDLGPGRRARTSASSASSSAARSSSRTSSRTSSGTSASSGSTELPAFLAHAVPAGPTRAWTASSAGTCSTTSTRPSAQALADQLVAGPRRRTGRSSGSSARRGPPRRASRSSSSWTTATCGTGRIRRPDAAGGAAEPRHHQAVRAAAGLRFVPAADQRARDPVPEAGVPDVVNPVTRASGRRHEPSCALSSRCSPTSAPAITTPGTMKGVVLGICPDATLVDISPRRPAARRAGGALELAACYRYFPPGTIFLVVVDPGVGSARRALAAEAGDYRFVAPDNGVLTAVFEETPPQARGRADRAALRAADGQPHVRGARSLRAGRRLAGQGHRGQGARPRPSRDFVRLDIPHAAA